MRLRCQGHCEEAGGWVPGEVWKVRRRAAWPQVVQATNAMLGSLAFTLGIRCRFTPREQWSQGCVLGSCSSGGEKGEEFKRKREETRLKRDGSQETSWGVLAQGSGRWSAWTQSSLEGQLSRAGPCGGGPWQKGRPQRSECGT